MFREFTGVGDVCIESIDSLFLIDILESDDGCSIITTVLIHLCQPFCIFGVMMVSTWVNYKEVQLSQPILTEEDHSHVILSFWLPYHGECDVLELFNCEMNGIDLFFD